MRIWLGPDGRPLPFRTDEQILDFLENADVVSWQVIEGARTAPRKVLLERDGVRAHAIFRNFRSEKRRGRIVTRDDFMFEIAAYRLDRLLRVHRVPPVVERTLFDTGGSLQIWVEQAMTERERRRRKIEPPDQEDWNRQQQVMRLFDCLINNLDRHRGNSLIDSKWRVWLIDHSRAFQPGAQLFKAERIERCERTLWARLQALEDRVVEEELQRFLRPREVSDLLARRLKLLEHVRRLIEEKGEPEVLFE